MGTAFGRSTQSLDEDPRLNRGGGGGGPCSKRWSRDPKFETFIVESRRFEQRGGGGGGEAKRGKKKNFVSRNRKPTSSSKRRTGKKNFITENKNPRLRRSSRNEGTGDRKQEGRGKKVPRMRWRKEDAHLAFLCDSRKKIPFIWGRSVIWATSGQQRQGTEEGREKRRGGPRGESRKGN